jgi:HD-GYP domain-containing protein (c-di-GMP phosphodiesterase class II)
LVPVGEDRASGEEAESSEKRKEYRGVNAIEVAEALCSHGQVSPDEVLLKPGLLTPDERLLVNEHPVRAVTMLEGIPFLKPALTIPRFHHERWDGSGYPDGLVGEEIPLEARLFAVVDVWDALISDRPYRPAWSEVKAFGYIIENAGVLFDPKCVEAFSRVVRPPVGYEVLREPDLQER